MISNQKTTERYSMFHGDCVDVAKTLPDNTIDLSIHSPPFSNLYIYSADPRDMGNTKDDEEFFEHYRYLIPEMLRITKPGRIAVVHCKDLPLYAGRDGAAGLKDFPGRIIREFESCGWTYHSRVTIWKDPVIEMQRTKAHGLLHRNFAERGEVVRQGCPDYLLMFRKWVDEMPDKQVKHSLVPGEYVGENMPTTYRDDRDYSIQVWQRYASPVWYDIKQTNVLNIKQARDSEDEKHICPLQLDVIGRCIHLWSNPDDVVYDPFSGLGSTGFEAIKMQRRYIGSELKDSYYQASLDNLDEAEAISKQVGLFV
jgi:DNA modification methylase